MAAAVAVDFYAHHTVHYEKFQSLQLYYNKTGGVHFHCLGQMTAGWISELF